MEARIHGEPVNYKLGKIFISSLHASDSYSFALKLPCQHRVTSLQ